MLISVIFVFVFSSLTFSSAVAKNDSTLPIQEANCVLPPYPKQGRYTVKNYPNATPGDKYPYVKLDVSCDTGHLNDNNNSSIFCINGEWSAAMPTCVRFCVLNNEPSIEYRCMHDLGSLEASKECESMVPTGTVVIPKCRSPNYFSSVPLTNMLCIEGIWNYKPVCQAECGTVSQNLDLVLDGTSSEQLPWHATIYKKELKPYMEICGGSLISPTTVISAASCFWNNARILRPARSFAVSVGNIHRPYNDPDDRNSQQSDVVEIKVPSRFRGAAANYQEDIAIVVVGTPFSYSPFVRPVCINFDYNFDKHQLKDGNLGKAASWNIAGKRSQILNIVDLPYMEIDDCISKSPPSFRQFITSDKICAGSNNGKTLCRGDSGTGYAFPELTTTTQRYYLRGVTSVAPTSDDECPSFNTFTSILKHEHFIKEYL